MSFSKDTHQSSHARSLRTQPNRILHQVPRPQCNSKRSAWGKINEHILVVYIFVNNVHGSWKPGPHAAGKNIFLADVDLRVSVKGHCLDNRVMHESWSG